MRLNKHIQKVSTRLLLCLYTFAMLKPILPIIKDGLSHLLYEQKHMATVHYEKGKYHLHVELVNTAKDKTHKQTNTSVFFESVHQHLSEKTNKPSLFPHVQSHSFVYSNQVYLFDCSTILTPPPKV
jgi:hypothetical protein